MAAPNRWEIFDDGESTTVVLHEGQSQLSIEVTDRATEFVFIDAEMKRSNVLVPSLWSDDVRSLLRAMMEATEARDGGR